MEDIRYANNRFDRVIEWTWLAVIFLIPLLFSPLCMTAYYFVKTMAMVMLVSLLLGCVIARNVLYTGRVNGFSLSKWVKGSPLQVAAVVLGLAYIISTVFSIIPHKSVMGNLAGALGLVPELAWITFFIILAGEVRSRAQVFRAIYALLLSTAVVSVFGIIQFFYPGVLPWFSYEGRVFSTDGNPLSLSGLLAVTMPLTLAMAILTWNDAEASFKGRLKPILLVVLFVLQMACTALAQYSITMLLFVIGIFVFFTLIGVYLKRKTTLALGILALLMLVAIAVYLVFPILFTSNPVVLSDNPAESPVVAEQVGLPTLSIRVHAWRSAADIVLESPQVPYYQDNVHFLRRLIGYGPETFIAVSQQTFPDALKSLYTHKSLVISQPENHFLYLAAAMGLLGLAAFLVLLAVFFFIALRLLIKTKDNVTGILAAAFVASGVQYCAHIAFNPAVITPEMSFWLIAALTVACTRLDGFLPDVPPETLGSAQSAAAAWKKVSAALIVIIFILIGAGLVLPPLLANMRAQEGLKLWDKEPARAMQKFEEAVRLQPEESYYHNFIGHLALSMAMSNAAGDARESLLQSGEDALGKAIEHEPQMAIWRYRLADMQMFRALLGNSGKISEAIVHYEQADRLFPGNAVILNKLALAQIISSKYDDAEKTLQQSLSADKKWVQTNFYYGLLLQHQGRGVEAGQQLVSHIDNRFDNIGYFINFCARAKSCGEIANIYAALHKYTELRADDWNGWMLSGITCMYAQKYTQAVIDFEKAADLVPDKQALMLAGITEGILKSNPEDPGAGHRIAEKLMQKSGKIR